MKTLCLRGQLIQSWVVEKDLIHMNFGIKRKIFVLQSKSPFTDVVLINERTIEIEGGPYIRSLPQKFPYHCTCEPG